MLKYASIYLFAVFISSCSQILLKKSSSISYPNKVKEYLNWHVITAYMIFFIATIINIFAYKGLNLSTASLLETTGYIYTLLFGKWFFKEELTLNKIIGICLICCGIVILFI